MSPGNSTRTVRLATSLTVAALALLASGCATAGGSATSAPPSWDFRAVDPGRQREVTLAQVIERLERADVVFFGEQHDDPGTHRAELELLEAIGRTGRPVVVSLEMFERDVQPMLDAYLAERIGESGFLAGSRPWPRYRSDYRPLVELAKSRGWPVVAANVPRSLASAVARRGLEALDSHAPAGRRHAARTIECPDDAYRSRFMEEMRPHSPGSGADTMPTLVAGRYYLSQCVKDETMAESIVDALRGAPEGAVVVHFTGAFHSDFRQGTVQRVARRAPAADLVVMTAVPVREPSSAPVGPHEGRADFVIFARRAPPPR